MEPAEGRGVACIKRIKIKINISVHKKLKPILSIRFPAIGNIYNNVLFYYRKDRPKIKKKIHDEFGSGFQLFQSSSTAFSYT